MAVNATAVWRVRPSGSNTNGGGYDAGIAGAATDYSRQNAAQASGTNGAGSATTTFTDTTANAFTSAMVGNCINIAGQGFYFVVTFTDAGHVVVDRALGTFSGASWSLGGGWADFFTNTTATVAALVPGNIVYILGSGIPNPASYTYDYTMGASFAPASGDAVNGFITYANDPSTPSYKAYPDTTGGMPVIKLGSTRGFGTSTFNYLKLEGLWFVASTGASIVIISNGSNPNLMLGCILDQFGFGAAIVNGSVCSLFGCEIFSSVANTLQSDYAVSGPFISTIIGCNFHDCVTNAVKLDLRTTMINTIVAKNEGTGITIVGLDTKVVNCTIDGNSSSGLIFNTQAILNGAAVFNNIISNHATAATFGMTVSAGTTAQNDLVKSFVDYNVFYNNNADLNAISYGPHDTHGGSNPYVGQATENYTLA
jgi:hypothetical protein